MPSLLHCGLIRSKKNLQGYQKKRKKKGDLSRHSCPEGKCTNPWPRGKMGLSPRKLKTSIQKGFTILNIIELICDSWEEVKISALTGAQKKLIQTLLDDFEGFKTSVEALPSRRLAPSPKPPQAKQSIAWEAYPSLQLAHSYCMRHGLAVNQARDQPHLSACTQELSLPQQQGVQSPHRRYPQNIQLW